jgi:hypothetical protein
MSEVLVVRMNENQMKALEAFIGRVQLNAKEVAAFNDLMSVFQKATPEQLGQEAAPAEPTLQ